jgi:threonine dehydrogenase-like Zn-dependent dehydrogenase
MKTSTICGSDIRCIYHEHLGMGPEGYQGVIAGHEPCGQIMETGSGCRRFRAGDGVIVYHISGCGVCNYCRRGYMISYTSAEYRRAYGWQRDGAMADYLVAEEKDLLALPAELSYADGAQVACGFDTVYEGLQKIGISGDDAVLITGLGPVGLAAGALCRKLDARQIIGVDVLPERIKLAQHFGLCDAVMASGPDNVVQVRSDSVARSRARHRLLGQRRGPRYCHPRHTQVGLDRLSGRRRTRGIPTVARHHPRSKTIYGSWVTSTWLMEELVERLVRWGLHPADLITHRFALGQVTDAYALMSTGRCGKVAVCFDDELRARPPQ